MCLPCAIVKELEVSLWILIWATSEEHRCWFVPHAALLRLVQHLLVTGQVVVLLSLVYKSLPWILTLSVDLQLFNCGKLALRQESDRI